MLKTTQSGYSGFLHDKYTVLKDTSERMVATSITSTWKSAPHLTRSQATCAPVYPAPPCPY